MQIFQQSWQRAWEALGGSPDAAVFDRLIARYSESHRRYHTLQHLQECIEQLEPMLAIAEHPGQVEVALWFHDAVYALQRQDNEQQSACWARQAVLASGAAKDSAERVYTLVLATRHVALPGTPDESLLVDVDLSILGAPRDRFEEYERQVRQEYEWVPYLRFCQSRTAVLRGFLDRAFIFSTEPFRTRLEAQARENLQRSLERLSAAR